jgi:hypothetical protein
MMPSDSHSSDACGLHADLDQCHPVLDRSGHTRCSPSFRLSCQSARGELCRLEHATDIAHHIMHGGISSSYVGKQPDLTLSMTILLVALQKPTISVIDAQIKALLLLRHYKLTLIELPAVQRGRQ